MASKQSTFKLIKSIEIEVPEWALPLRKKSRYKAAHGGRSGGKSHYFAEALIQRMIANPDLRVACIREIQKSLQFSSKLLLEKKIKSLNVSDQFCVQNNFIKRNGGTGIFIFLGMQDHTAESVKGLEDTDIAWVDEASNLSRKSLKLLTPTIRKPGSEIWFSWNPKFPEDPVDQLFRSGIDHPDSIVVQVNYDQNKKLSNEIIAEIEYSRKTNYQDYLHIWKGNYVSISNEQVIAKNCIVQAVDIDLTWDGPYHGADWGFSVDPTAAVCCWVKDRFLFIKNESYQVDLEISDTAKRWLQDIPEIDRYVVRADSSSPGIISHVKRDIPKLIAAEKYPGSVDDGVKYLQNFERIFIDPSCENTIKESRLWCWKTNSAGDILPELKPGYDHIWDAVRYALMPLIKQSRRKGTRLPKASAHSNSPAKLRQIF